MKVAVLVQKLFAMNQQAEVYFDFEGCEDYMVFDEINADPDDPDAVIITLADQPEEDEDEED